MTPDYRQGVLDALGCIVEVCKHHAADDPIDGDLLLCDVIDAALRPLGDDPLANETRAEWVALRAELSEIKGSSA